MEAVLPLAGKGAASSGSPDGSGTAFFKHGSHVNAKAAPGKNHVAPAPPRQWFPRLAYLQL